MVFYEHMCYTRAVCGVQIRACYCKEHVMAGTTQRTAEALYVMLVEAFCSHPDVTVGISGKKGFGSSALCVNDKIFAMLSQGALVLKLPRQRIDALIAQGAGRR